MRLLPPLDDEGAASLITLPCGSKYPKAVTVLALGAAFSVGWACELGDSDRHKVNVPNVPRSMRDKITKIFLEILGVFATCILQAPYWTLANN